MFAVFNAAIIPCVWWFFPETKGRTLEELDVVFAKANAEGTNPVSEAKHMDRLVGPTLDAELQKYFSRRHVDQA